MLRGPSLFGALVALALAGTAPASTAPGETAEAAAAPPGYVVEILPLLGGQLGGTGQDINSAEDVCGWGLDAGGASTRALVWKNGAVRDISADFPGSRLVEAYGINDAGQVVGRTFDNRSFLWENGSVSILPGIGARDINEAGHVIVRTTNGVGLVKDGQLLPQTMPGINQADFPAYATGINENDEYCGWYRAPGTNQLRAFVVRDGIGQDLQTAGLDRNEAYDINESGIIAGTMQVTQSPPQSRGTLWESLTPDPIVTSAQGDAVIYAINDRGQIAGLDSSNGGLLVGKKGSISNAGRLGFIGFDGSGFAINNRGSICGSATADPLGGYNRAFIARPRAATVQGTIEFEKLKVTSRGLIRKDPDIQPARGVLVEVVLESAGEVLGDGRTDEDGKYDIGVTKVGKVFVHALADSEDDVGRIHVSGPLGSPLANSTYTAESKPFTLKKNAHVTKNLLAVDKNRGSGPFNILDVLQQANARINEAAPGTTLPALTVRWWTGANDPGGTRFQTSTNTAIINGDRGVDSDEFDDTVINHEYGHFIHRTLSRNDSPGGRHTIGDKLDARLAFSEGWANFFGCTFLTEPTSLYRDTKGPNGRRVFQQDLEVDLPSGDNPGYWSEASVQGLLWDLFDGEQDGETVSLDRSRIWGAFIALRTETFVYLIDFCEALFRADPSLQVDLEVLAAFRSITYTAGADPPVPIPFPRRLTLGSAATDSVDSIPLNPRSNLDSSSHFYEFQHPGGRLRAVLQISAGASPPADLDLFLLNLNGDELSKSNNINGPGDTETIDETRAAGTYVLEVRSWSLSGAGLLANSGTYTLTATAP